MSSNERKAVESIREFYEEPKKSRLDDLVKLNMRVERPAKIFAFSFGTVGALVLGTGMSLAMGVIGGSLGFAIPLGIAIGALGITAVSFNYNIYKALLKSRRAKYRDEIIAMSDELIGDGN